MYIARQPTRSDNILDRVFVSNPDLYCMVRVVTSVVIVQTSSACRNLLLIQLLNKQQIFGMRSLSALLPRRLSGATIKPYALHALLAPQSTTSQNYHLRQRVHDRQLPVHLGHLIDKNFITRYLYKDMY